MSLPCGHKSNTETVAQYRKRCGGRPLGMIQKVSESEVKTIHKILTQYGKSSKDATDMIKKNYKKVVQKFKGDSSRDKAMAILGYSLLGESITKSQIKKMRDKFKKTGELPDHLKKFVKAKKEFEKKFKVKNVVVPGLEWMSDLKEAPRKPRKKGQHRNSPNHSDLYTDENPKGTIKGLKFATVQDAEKSVSKIRSSGKSHAHKIQAAVAMEQRAKEMGKSSQAAVYRKFINKMKKKTKQKNEGWSDKYKKSIDCNNPKGFSQKAHCAGRNKQESKMSLKLEELVGKKLTEAQFDEAAGEKDACYHKVKARYDVWPSAYASGALVKCRKVGAKNWGNKSKKESTKEGVYEKNKGKTLYGKDLVNYFVKRFKYSTRDATAVANKLKDVGFKVPKVLPKYESTNEGYSMRDIGLSPFFKKLSNHQRQAVSIALVMGGNMTGAIQAIEKIKKGLSKDKKVKNALRMANESINENQCLCEACWKGYTKKGMKKMFGKMYPNCVKNESYDIWNEDGSFGYTMTGLIEAEYQGRKVKLGKPMQGDSKKFKVYVKNDKGNVVKVNFGQGGDAKGGTMRIRKSNPKARKSFRARHNCDNPGPRHKARYWSCKKW